MASPSLDKWKATAAQAAARARKVGQSGKEQVAALRAKNAAKMKEVTQQTRAQQAGGLIGAHATAVIAGQVHRELGVVRGRTTLARGINYGAGAAGIAIAVYAKNPMARSAGAALCGMSIYQVGRDTEDYDLVPGFNPEQAAGG